MSVSCLTGERIREKMKEEVGLLLRLIYLFPAALPLWAETSIHLNCLFWSIRIV